MSQFCLPKLIVKECWIRKGTLVSSEANPSFLREGAKLRRQDWTCCVVEKERLGPGPPGSMLRVLPTTPASSKAWECLLGARPSAAATSRGERGGQRELDLASIQQAQWTLSAIPSSDLLTLSRVINQPNGFPLPSLGIQIITTPTPTAGDQSTPVRFDPVLQCHVLHQLSFSCLKIRCLTKMAGFEAATDSVSFPLPLGARGHTRW